MSVKDRIRLGIGLVLTLALVVPLAWMWWDSRLPGSYSVMDMGEPVYGGGPAAEHAHHAAGSAASGTSVVDLDTKETGKPDVTVDLTAEEGEVTLASGRTVQGYSLNGTTPGPTIEATVGDLVEVRVRNESVHGGVALHWHGVDVPNAQDGVAGVTQDAVGVGEEHTYRWVAPDAGTYWYHSHQLSHEQVSGGLYGAVLIHPEQREADVRDVLVQTHVYDGQPTIDGERGYKHVDARPGERLRVRLVNTDNGALNVWVSVPFLIRAVDGFDVTEPTPVSDRTVEIPAGGRVDLEVAVPADGESVRVAMEGEVGVTLGPETEGAPQVRQPDDGVDLLGYGSPADVGFDLERADRTFEYSVGRRPGFLNGRPGIWWSVNGKLYKDMPMFVVREGDVVRVRISNHSGKAHPMHLHGHHAVVLSRDGKKATGSPWWFDSLEVQDDETFDVAFLADNPGVWMDHCHNLRHAREGLVTHLMYQGVTTPFRVGKDSGNTPE